MKPKRRYFRETNKVGTNFILCFEYIDGKYMYVKFRDERNEEWINTRNDERNLLQVSFVSKTCKNVISFEELTPEEFFLEEL